MTPPVYSGAVFFMQDLQIPWKQLLWAIFVVLSAAQIWISAGHLGPALHANHGQGTAGFWTASERGKNGAWYGEFVANSGTDTDTLPNVKYAGAPSTVQAGTTLPALDTGAGDEVYPPTGSGEWIHVVLGLVVCTVVLSALLTKGLFVVRRRVRARRADYLTEEADSLP